MSLPVELRELIFQELARSLPDEHQEPDWAVDWIPTENNRINSPPHLQDLTAYEGWLVKCIRAPYRINWQCYVEARQSRLVSLSALTVVNQSKIPEWRINTLVYLLRTRGLPNT